MDIIHDTLDRIDKITREQRVFVSYTSTDRSFVETLTNSLESLSVRLWIDYREIRVGDSIIAEISKGLQEVDALVVILSQASVKSRWVTEEINAAFMAMVEGKGVRLCPVLIQSCDVPVLLRNRKYADFTKGFGNGIRELIEGIIPDHKRWEEIKALAQEFHATVEKLPHLTSKIQIYQSLAVLDTLLTIALAKRYQIAVKNDVHRSLTRADFYTMFGYLEFKGFHLKSTVWASLRDFRNQFVHGHPGIGFQGGILLDNDPKVVEYRTTTAVGRAEEARTGLKELTRLMGTLCTP